METNLNLILLSSMKQSARFKYQILSRLLEMKDSDGKLVKLLLFFAQFLEQKHGYYHCKDCNIRWESACVWCVQGTNKVSKCPVTSHPDKRFRRV